MSLCQTQIQNSPCMKKNVAYLQKRMNEYSAKSIVPLIMIVDDSPINIVMLTLMLKRIGFDERYILQANDGHEAIKLLEENKNIKTIFMDIEMPIINGFQTTQLIKNRKSKQQLNIIAYTSLNDDETILKCKDAGMDFYLEKPCNLNQVSSVMQNYYFI